jgi:hypothetical protein
LTGSAGSILIFKKIQNDIVLIKKKQKSTGCNRVFDRVLPGHRVNPPGHDFFYFFINPAWFQPESAGSRVDPQCLAEF